MTKTNEEIFKEIRKKCGGNLRHFFSDMEVCIYCQCSIEEFMLEAMNKARKEAETELLDTLEKKISKGGNCDCGYEIYLLQKKARGEK